MRCITPIALLKGRQVPMRLPNKKSESLCIAKVRWQEREREAIAESQH
jgi:hypothetical protein